jgi:NAD-dependent DNA ligase
MTDDTRLHVLYGHARLADREVDELVGLAHGLTADGTLVPAEIEYLEKWLVSHDASLGNPMVRKLLTRVDEIVAHVTVNPEEAADLFKVLQNFAAGDFELGEALKSTSLPLDAPPPTINFQGARFCFTGTFTFGTRRECEAAATGLGGVCGGLSRQTRYLVVGAYATDSWMHSAFGRKIENAVQMRSEGVPIAIVAEQHWVGYVGRK